MARNMFCIFHNYSKEPGSRNHEVEILKLMIYDKMILMCLTQSFAGGKKLALLWNELQG